MWREREGGRERERECVPGSERGSVVPPLSLTPADCVFFPPPPRW